MYERCLICMGAFFLGGGGGGAGFSLYSSFFTGATKFHFVKELSRKLVLLAWELVTVISCLESWNWDNHHEERPLTSVKCRGWKYTRPLNHLPSQATTTAAGKLNTPPLPPTSPASPPSYPKSTALPRRPDHPHPQLSPRPQPIHLFSSSLSASSSSSSNP